MMEPTIRVVNDELLHHPELGQLPIGYSMNEQGELVSPLEFMRPCLNRQENIHVSNATLRHEEWEFLDDRINGVFRERLTVADDLRSRGLVQPLSIGSVVRRTERVDDIEDAEISFDGDTAPRSDRANFEADVIPVPIIAKDFRVNWRQLAASRMRGEPLDTTMAEMAARKVRDKLQDLITNGLTTGGPQGGGIPGLTGATNRLTATLANNWDATGGDPVGDIQGMLNTAYASSLFGPFTVYVPKNYWATIQGDYSTAKGDNTILQRILQFEDIEAVRPNDALADDNVVMVQMTRDVIDLSEAQAVTTVQWQKNPFVTLFRVLFVGGPQIKNGATDQDTTVHGIVHLS